MTYDVAHLRPTHKNLTKARGKTDCGRGGKGEKGRKKEGRKEGKEKKSGKKEEGSNFYHANNKLS